MINQSFFQAVDKVSSFFICVDYNIDFYCFILYNTCININGRGFIMFFKKSNNNVYKDRNQIEFVCLEQIVPEEHLLRKIENVIDFSFIHKYTKEYYSENKGRPCIDPVILFKIIFLNYFYGKNSVRATIEEIKVNMAYRWFLGLSITDTVPNYSTFSQNYIRRFKNTNVFENIFSTVITKLFEMNLVDTSVIFVDGTHVKASANKHKIIKKQVKVIADKYQKAMEEEINEYRKEMGREFYDDDSDGSGFTVNEETVQISTKDIITPIESGFVIIKREGRKRNTEGIDKDYVFFFKTIQQYPNERIECK
jgi:transposase